MSACKRQALIDAPVESIWDLVGNPSRHPEWWPRVIEVQGERFNEGDDYVQITRGPVGSDETSFLVERRDDLREVMLRCQLTGTYAHWMLTSAQGGTFVDLEMGMDPKAFSYKVFDATVGRRFFKRWAEESIDALERAACAGSGATGAAAGRA
jgi:Polyketide cyclase / dehydrase and lipid transport